MSKIIQITATPVRDGCRIFALRDDGSAFELAQEMGRCTTGAPHWQALPEIPQAEDSCTKEKKERLAQLKAEANLGLKEKDYQMWCALRREIAFLETTLGLRT